MEANAVVLDQVIKERRSVSIYDESAAWDSEAVNRIRSETTSFWRVCVQALNRSLERAILLRQTAIIYSYGVLLRLLKR